MDSTECSPHKDLRQSQVVHSEENTCKVVEAISNFINPFEVENGEVLYCLSSGAPAPREVEQDLLSVDEIGQKAYTRFVHERLMEKTKSFNDPIKKL